MKNYIMICLTAMMFLVTAPPAKSQFTNFCNQTAITMAADTISLDGSTLIKVTPVATAETYTVTLAMQSSVSDTSEYYAGITQTSTNPTMIFFGLDNKVLYWMRATICSPTPTVTNTKCCYVKTTAFTSQSKLAATVYPAWEQEDMTHTPRAAITGDGRYRKPQ